VQREIITIDDEKCDGCGLCVPNCPEGALQMVDGKAKLVGEIYCDGLGACIGHCPQGAITVEEREADQYDERLVIENVVTKGEDVVREHLEHLEEHNQREYVKEAIRYLVERNMDIPEEFRKPEYVSPAIMGKSSPGKGQDVTECGCPGSRVVDLRGIKGQQHRQTEKPSARRTSRLQQWPVQIHLVPPTAPYLDGADLLIAADCVPFAFADFHEDLLCGRIVLVGCPKLDDAEYYREKLTAIFSQNDIRTITVAHMEVPCCFGLANLVRSAVAASGKEIPLEEVMISIKGERMQHPERMAR
jgi:ferredoxin